MARPKFSRKRTRNVAWRSSVAKKPRVPRMFAKNDVRYDRQVVESMSVGLGQGVRTRLRTFGHVQRTLGATGISAGFLKPGSCYNPFGDMDIIQPNMFDTWKSVYGRYVVLSARIRITPTSQATGVLLNQAGSGTLVAYPSLNSTAKTALDDAASQPYAKTVLFHGAGSDPKSLYFNLNHKAVLGKFGPLTSSENGGLVTADPSTSQYMVLPVFFQSALSTATSGNVTYEIEIIQDVWFDRRRNVDDITE